MIRYSRSFHRIPSRHRNPSRRGGMLGGLLVCFILVGIVGAIGYKFFYADSSRVSPDDLIVQLASRGPFDHIVLEQGEIESSSNKDVICEVKSRGMGGTAILWVIDEGTKVKAGDKLVEIDSSELELQLKEKRIKVITAEARMASAKALVEQAEISKQEYLEGVFLTDQKTILSEIAIAEQNLRKATLAKNSSERLVFKGLFKSLQLEADEFAVENAKNKLDSEKGKLRVLEILTKKKMLVQFDSDIESAKAAMSAATSEFTEEEAELAEIEEQISKCVMVAPADGVVVHANRYSSRGGSAEFVVEAGATVRERQEIIRLPDPSSMQVKCKINESQITLIHEGMAAKVSVDAIPGMKLTGRVTKVNRYAEPSSFFSSSIKEYATIIEIIDPPETIRTGMTAEVQIFVQQLEDALQIPIQGLYEHGNEMYTLIQKGPETFVTAKVAIGATNDTMASITDGLAENDQVVLNLREHLLLMNLPEIAREDNSEMRALAKEGIAAAGPGGPETGRPETGGPETGRPETGRPGAGGPGGREGGQRGGGRFGAGGGQHGAGGGPGGQRGAGGGQRGAGGGQRGAGGGQRGGPGGGGGMPDVNTIVSRSMERSDTDGDGKLSAKEIGAIDAQWRGSISAADTDGDGSVSRAELTASMKKRFSQRGGGR